MTIAAVLLALALLVNKISVTYQDNLLLQQHFSAKLVFLLSVCLFLHSLRLFHCSRYVKIYPLCFVVENFLNNTYGNRSNYTYTETQMMS
ncbi:unnamed protein product [Leptidea sinapis]|uniref:Secreted protein n=1 Tax=Leptidea sinapis TaxID=189913 RepID=A0A5E4QRQ9_9NEOP|nr:unnamed protein product [Leptidea sinapis]